MPERDQERGERNVISYYIFEANCFMHDKTNAIHVKFLGIITYIFIAICMCVCVCKIDLEKNMIKERMKKRQKEELEVKNMQMFYLLFFRLCIYYGMILLLTKVKSMLNNQNRHSLK